MASFFAARWQRSRSGGGAIVSLWVRRKHPAAIDNHRSGLIMRAMKRLGIAAK
jgi:hypothetical protein